jgi:glycosyltransferase involved in cell wall biosynthesis
MQRKITIDARMVEHSGIGTYLRNLLENFATIENDYVFDLICTRRESLHGLPPARFRFVSAGSPIYTLSEQWEMARLARGAQLLHSPHYNAPLLHLGKLVVTIHDLIHLTDPNFKRTLAARCYAWPMLNLVARKADCIISTSEFTKQQIVEHLAIPPAKVTVAHLGVNDHFCPHDRRQAILRASSLLGLRRPFVLFVGNLKPHKNVKTLIHAFSRICAKRDFGHQLVILGDDQKWKPGLLSECEKLGISERVLFVAQAPYEELPWVYGAAEILVVPSLIEGFGLPVLEAMACGTPVVCSRAASLPEVAGNSAEYFEPTSVDDLTAAIERVLGAANSQENLRRKGLERVKLFSWAECARKHFRVYQEVLGP